MQKDPSNTHKAKPASRRYRKEAFKTPILILAGGASLMDDTAAQKYLDFIREVMTGFTGTIISGGTKAGIPGLAGFVKEALQEQGKVAFNLAAYLPGKLPADAERSLAYDQFFETDSDKFSVLEILAYWTDLLTQGISPWDVILVGINGGEIAASEYRLALALGAKVILVEGSGRAASEMADDPEWNQLPNFIMVANDPVAIGKLLAGF